MEASKLNATYIPKELLRKHPLSKSSSPFPAADSAEDPTAGNSFIRFEPAEVKFSGYKLGKSQSASVRVLNLSPVIQRVQVLPPSASDFSVKSDKKGSIAPGMSEVIEITFCCESYKYQYDVVKVKTETGSFVIPIYAYPSIPSLETIFPRIVDFGSVPLNTSDSNLYTIDNPIPMDFPFEFNYVEESPAFIITPITGVIAANQVTNIEITFIPAEKKTYVAEAYLSIKQFDFQPIKIKIMGTGRSKEAAFSTKRIKSSKLNPIKNTDTFRQTDTIKKTEVKQQSSIRPTNLLRKSQKSFIRTKTSAVGLGSMRKELGMSVIDDGKKENNREYLSRYAKIQELDKEKEVKFCQFLGDKPMNQEELQFEYDVMEETAKAKLENMRISCCARFETENANSGEVQYAKFTPETVTWDVNKNDELARRKEMLKRLAHAGSKVIEKYRLEKRLKKIRQFLSGCQSKQDVEKKVNEDYAKSLDFKNNSYNQDSLKLSFSALNIRPSLFPIQHKDQTNQVNKQFQVEANINFDDDAVLEQIKASEIETMGYQKANFPSDFTHPLRSLPPPRFSAEEEFNLKTAALPSVKPLVASSVYEFPLAVPAHQYIYNRPDVVRFKGLEGVTETDARYLLTSSKEAVEDEFEGWAGGEMDVLKAKFLRNTGCDYYTISQFDDSYDAFSAILALNQQIPKEISNMESAQEAHEEFDSDQENLNELAPQQAAEFLLKLEAPSQKATARRTENKMESFEGQLISEYEKQLKAARQEKVCEGVRKIRQTNKWAEQQESQILI